MVSIIIPTCNRVQFWREGFLLDSIAAQVDRNFEVLICDDNSDDGTVDFLREDLARRQLPARLYRTKFDRNGEVRLDSTIPDQLLFGMAAGEVVLHLDDDGWTSPHVVGFLNALKIGNRPAAYFGNVQCVDPVDRTKVIRADSRLGPRARSLPPGKFAIMPLGVDPGEAFQSGSIWAAPTAVLRKMGGHDLLHLNYRGCDARIGYRMARMIPTFLVGGDVLRFWHVGLSTYWQAADAEQREHVMANTRTVMQGGVDKSEPVMNGGAEYWSRPHPFEWEEISLTPCPK